MSDRRYSDYISAWGYIGYAILWSIPVIGWFIWLINCFSRKDNLKNYARSIFCGFLLSLIVAGLMVALCYVALSMGYLTPEMFETVTPELTAMLS